MRQIAFSVLLVCLPLQVLRAGPCANTKGKSTYLGSHVFAVSKHADPVRSVQGVISAAQGLEDYGPAEGVLVELFDHPEIASHPDFSPLTPLRGQKRLAACITAKDGRFSFNPPAGKYELRISKPFYNVVSVIVTVSKRTQNKEPIEVGIRVAD